jgi:hypothetical protein
LPLFKSSSTEAQDERPESEAGIGESEDGSRDPVVDKVMTDAKTSSNNTLSAGFKVPSLPTHLSNSKPTDTKSTPSTRAVNVEEEDDIDAPPPFPLPDSAQRSKGPAPKTTTSRLEPTSVPSFNVAPPSPEKGGDDDEPPSDLNIAITPGTIPLGNMAPPPSTTSRPDFGMQKGGLTAPGRVPEATRKRAKVALGPGYSPLDWARLTQSGRNLRGIEGPMRVTVTELQKVLGALISGVIGADEIAQVSI